MAAEARLVAAPTEIGRRALARALATIGGAPHPPRHDRLERLWREVAGGLDAGRTLAGCGLAPAAKGRLLLTREARACTPPLVLAPGTTACWDRRFRIDLADGPACLRVGALGSAGWRQVAAHVSPAVRLAVPAAARAALPAFWDNASDGAGPLAVPHLDFRDARAAIPAPIVATVRFLPTHPLAGADFAVA